VVLYEEGLDQKTVNGACRAIADADMLIIGGTSLTVYPAAGFVNLFRGKHLVLMNRTPTPMDSQADLVITDPIGEVFSQIKV
jgi:NAD-dependent deacetylase